MPPATEKMNLMLVLVVWASLQGNSIFLEKSITGLSYTFFGLIRFSYLYHVPTTQAQKLNNKNVKSNWYLLTQVCVYIFILKAERKPENKI